MRTQFPGRTVVGGGVSGFRKATRRGSGPRSRWPTPTNITKSNASKPVKHVVAAPASLNGKPATQLFLSQLSPEERAILGEVEENRRQFHRFRDAADRIASGKAATNEVDEARWLAEQIAGWMRFLQRDLADCQSCRPDTSRPADAGEDAAIHARWAAGELAKFGPHPEQFIRIKNLAEFFLGKLQPDPSFADRVKAVLQQLTRFAGGKIHFCRHSVLKIARKLQWMGIAPAEFMGELLPLLDLQGELSDR